MEILEAKGYAEIDVKRYYLGSCLEESYVASAGEVDLDSETPPQTRLHSKVTCDNQFSYAVTPRYTIPYNNDMLKADGLNPGSAKALRTPDLKSLRSPKYR